MRDSFFVRVNYGGRNHFASEGKRVSLITTTKVTYMEHYFSRGQKDLQPKHIFSFIFVELQLQVTL